MSISESENQSPSEATEPTVSESVGDLLSSERARLGLTEKDVADQLHITMHYVRAIESNSFEKLPGAVFAKGYIKSYALLLELDVDRVLAGYNEFLNEQQDAAREKTRIQVRRRKDKGRLWVTASALAFFSLFLAVWFFNSSPAEEAESASPGITVSSAVPEEAGAQTSDQDGLDSSPVESEITESESALGQEPLSAILSSGLEETEAANGDDLAESLSFESDRASADTEEVVDDATATIVDALLETAASEALPVTDSLSSDLEIVETASQRVVVEAQGEDTLIIRFSGESWVEVSDDSQELMFRDLQVAGNELEVRGAAPFNVLLGDAPFARITLNGIDIDFSNRVRIDNSARLEIGR